MPENPDQILGCVLIGIAAFLLGGAVTALCILIRRKRDREERQK